jgi:hypothetical protein
MHWLWFLLLPLGWVIGDAIAMVRGGREHNVHARGWVWMRRMDLVAPDGDLYLRRFYLLRTKRWGGLMLHRIVRGDHDPTLHSHPWPFWSLILRGGYTERLADPVEAYTPERIRLRLDRHRYETHRAGKFRKFPEGSLHRIDSVKPHTWTLVVNGKYRHGWGFWVADDDDLRYGRVAPWQEYLESTGRNAVGKAIDSASAEE